MSNGYKPCQWKKRKPWRSIPHASLESEIVTIAHFPVEGNIFPSQGKTKPVMGFDLLLTTCGKHVTDERLNQVEWLFQPKEQEGGLELEIWERIDGWSFSVNVFFPRFWGRMICGGLAFGTISSSKRELVAINYWVGGHLAFHYSKISRTKINFVLSFFSLSLF